MKPAKLDVLVCQFCYSGNGGYSAILPQISDWWGKVHVMLGEAPPAQQFSRELFKKGVFATAVGFPTVAKGKARIRAMISAAHDGDDLGQGLEAFATVGRKLGVIK